MNRIFWLSLVSIVLILYVYIKTYLNLKIFNGSSSVSFKPLRVYSDPTDSSLWKNKDQSHGFQTNRLTETSSAICNSFFILW